MTCVRWIFALLVGLLAQTAFAQTAIPSGERSTLLALYNQTGGQNWTNNAGWGGAVGTECGWFGVICSTNGSNVEMVILPSNNLAGTLPAITGLTQLKQLTVRGNKLSGNLPSLAGLTQFTALFAGDNQFSGSIPSLSGLTNLTYFNVFQNQLTGSIPSLAGLTNLQTLYVYNNQLTGNLPSVAGLTNLIEFRAQFNQLTGSIPPLTGLTNLQIYGVGANRLTGTLPSLSGLTNLQVFNAYTNQLTGTIPSLAGLSNLKQINVSENQLTGSIPSLAGLNNLIFVELHANNLTGSIPALGGLTNLYQFAVYSNRLTGSLPSLAGLPAIVDFEAFSNQLTGTIPSFTGVSSTLQYYFVGGNQLTGAIPSLAGLPNLAFFSAPSNQLTGTIPSLTGLGTLQSLALDNNQLSGAIPSLSGLSNLQSLTVSNNRLSGTLPSLSGLNQLQNFSVGGNGFSGDVPTAPASLAANGSSLCNNALNHVANAAWDAATASTPWYLGCTVAPATLKLTTTDSTVATGTQTTITASVNVSSLGAFAAAASDPPTGNVTITDDSGKVICYIKIVSGSGSCNVQLPSGATTNLNGGYSGNINLAPASTSFSKTAPVAVSGNLDQHGWTGTWYNPATSGQGFVIEIYPDLISTGNGLFAGSWFTFDMASGGEDKKRWYTLVGNALSSSTTTTLDIISPTGGNFAAAPIINSGNGQNVVGHATINFTDCTHGYLSYSFTDGSSRVGNIPLQRLDNNVTCNPTNGAGNGTPPGKFLLSGAWYTPSTSGQGLLFDINPVQNIAVAAWYTYAPNGQAVGGGASQRWYTLQIANADVGTTPLTNIGIYSAQGGTFDVPGGVTTPQVGSASIAFNNCNSMVLNYTFTSGTNAGLSGTLNLQRPGPVPAGCSL